MISCLSNNQKILTDASVAKGTCCSYRKPRFASSIHIVALHNSSSKGFGTFFWHLRAPYTSTVSYIYAGKPHMHTIKIKMSLKYIHAGWGFCCSCSLIYLFLNNLFSFYVPIPVLLPPTPQRG